MRGMITTDDCTIAYIANRNANGMLLFPSESSMMADDTKGPTKADVFPTIENSAKKRNLRAYVSAGDTRL